VTDERLPELASKVLAGSASLIEELEKIGVVSQTSFVLTSEISFDQYEAVLSMLGALHAYGKQLQEQSCWLIGDALSYGEKVYGETYAQASLATGLAPQTLANYNSVCSRIPRSQRRPKLAFSTHAEVAYLEPKERATWLKRAVDNGWKRSDLRAARKEDREQEEVIITAGGTEVLPAESNGHVCWCPACGRSHFDNLDVEAPGRSE